ncbi:exported protein of unknown function (plasmid) [Shinella sp. WSC3-e]|nr:exported hypothetical protein [Rhizobiaceae bacterium]CAK7261062.1 exported protein of unknown function [Shinella sp. WSC3-e]
MWRTASALAACVSSCAFCSLGCMSFPSAVNLHPARSLTNRSPPSSCSSFLIAVVKDGCETFEALAAWVKLRCWQTAKKYLIWFISTATVSVTFRHEVHHSTCLSKNRSSGLVPEAFGMGKGCIETKHNDLSIRRRP